MRQLSMILALVAFTLIAFRPSPAWATFHLWDIVEIFSNDDGSVQFIELFNFSDFEDHLQGHEISSTANSYTFPTDLGTNDTSDRSLLLATPGFADLPGGVTPDFTIPQQFFDPTGDGINFANVDQKSFSSLPTDGEMSLNYPGSSEETNSPTNFVGDSGSVDLSAPMPTGDYNGNGVVDAADYTVWRDVLGQSVDANGDGADGNANGVVDAADYTFWKERFGDEVAGSGGAAAARGLASMPEPAAGAAVGLALLTLAGAGWRPARPAIDARHFSARACPQPFPRHGAAGFILCGANRTALL